MIQLSQKHRTIISEILKKYPYQFYVFGSRTKGLAKPLSDLDLCIMGKISLRELAKIDADFEESDLPFKVDIIPYQECDKKFQQRILPDLIIFPKNNGLVTEGPS